MKKMQRKNKDIMLTMLTIIIIVLLAIEGLLVMNFKRDNTIVARAKEAKKMNLENEIAENANTPKIANGVQFVWIPVNNPSEMFGIDGEGNCGKLYNFPNNPDLLINENRPTNIGRREPDILLQHDINNLEIMNSILGESYYENLDAFKNGLQLDFDKMRSSVEKYGGFYVGRYESSMVTNDNNLYLAPKKGVKSQTDKTWYVLYARQKSYKKNDIEGSMIWGCQYNEMLKCMQKYGVRDITKYRPIDIGKESPAIRNSSEITGEEEKDKLYNIYDLIGNSCEWTLEASYDYCRILRGGSRYNSREFSPSHAQYGGPTASSRDDATRATLYIP